MKITVKLKKAIEKYIEGKDAAFTDIYNESYKYVYVCVNNVVSGNDNKEDIIQDIMQDTYVEISKHIKSLENVDKFFPWAGTIATRKCYEYIKKSGKYTLLDEDENFDNLSDDDNIIPEEIMQNKEKQRLLREIIQNELTEMQRLCIVGYFYNEMKQSEIAKELGIPENSVKSHLLRGKAKIKEAVIELDEKKGTRLYSVSPVLLLLFSDEVKACTVSAKIGQSVLSSVGVTAVKTTVAAIKIKTLIIAVTSAITIGGVTAGIVIANNNSKNDNNEEETTTELLPIDVEFPTIDAPREVIESTDSVAGNWASLMGDVIELIPARGNEAEVYLPNKNIFYKGIYETDDKTYIKINFWDTSDSQHRGVIYFYVQDLYVDSDGRVTLILTDEDGIEYRFWPAG